MKFLQPAPATAPLADDKIDPTYRRLRFQVFLSIFFGYTGYYLVRKNFTLAMPFLQQQGLTKSDLGLALSAISIAYGWSKFVMGSVSDRSNPRLFLPIGLILSALTMLVMGFFPFATSSVLVMFVLLFINGWAQGMGWPACGRTMVHWFSFKERGTKMAVWNVAHNVGGGLIGPLFILGMALFGDWRSAFYVPAMLAIGIAVYAFFAMRDTPQSCGLPSIEHFKNDFPKDYDSTESEKELSTKEILFKYVLNNKLLWYIAIANAFVYLVRYGIIDWAPTYLAEVKHLSTKESSWAYFAYEYAGIPGTLLCGFLSDKVFRGNRAPANLIFLVGVFAAILVYWLNPPGHPNIDYIALTVIGLLIYGPVMLIGVHALDLAPKKAAGTAAGFTGLFGYFGGGVIANALMGYVVDHFGWDGGFILMIGGMVITMFFITLTWAHESGFIAKFQSAKQKGLVPANPKETLAP